MTSGGINAIYGELGGVDSVEVVEAKGRQIFGASGGDFVIGKIDGFESGAEHGIVARGLLLNFFECGKRNGGAKIIGKDEVVLKSGEDQNGEIEARV